MKITFCLPANSYRTIAGGYKVVYEYSNRLVRKGHEVTLVMNTSSAFKDVVKIEPLRKQLCKFWVSVSPRWFRLDKRIRKISADGIYDRYVPKGDAVFATAVQTAERVASLSEDRGKKVYIIQDFEDWQCDAEYVLSTYKLGMENLVVSRWLERIVKESGAWCNRISNPIDTEHFYVKQMIFNRREHSIGVLYHVDEHKGFKYAAMVIKRIKDIFPDLEVNMFGTPEKPRDLDFDFKYIRNATPEELNELYNSVRVFLCMSVKEGFGLTGAESMACGCCLVSTDFEGVFDYAVNNENAVIVPVGDVGKAVDAIISLFSDQKMMKRISETAADSMKERNWDNAVETLENILTK